MKRTILVCMLFGATVASAQDVPAGEMKFQIIDFHQTHKRESYTPRVPSDVGNRHTDSTPLMTNYSGYGRGTVTGATTQSVDFSFTCDADVLASSHDRTYPARWTQPGTELQIDIPGPFAQRCRVATVVEPIPYTFQSLSMARRREVMWEPDITEAEQTNHLGRGRDGTRNPEDELGMMSPWPTPDPAFPDRVAILAEKHYPFGAGNQTISMTNGLLIVRGHPLASYAFHADCARGFEDTVQPAAAYSARWRTPGKELEILTIVPGETRPKSCLLKLYPAPAKFADAMSHPPQPPVATPTP